MATATRDPSTVGWDGHLLLLHRTEEERCEVLASWVARGLESDEKVLYTERGDESPDRCLLGILERHGVDAGAAVAEGRLSVLPLLEFYPPEGQAHLVDRALDEGFRRVRMSSEARAALTRVAQDDYEHFEDAMDLLCATRPVSALCQYDQSVTTGWWLRRATGTHLTGLRETQLRTAPAAGGLALSGSVDVSNDGVLTAMLAHATTTLPEGRGSGWAEDGMLWLDLSALDFIDVSGCRALATATERFRRGGGAVAVLAPAPVVDRTLRLMGFDEMPGMAIVSGRP